MRRAYGWLMVAALAVGCGEGKQAGELAFDFDQVPAGAGAVAFAIVTMAPNTLAGVSPACAGCQVFTLALSDTEIRGVLVGTLTAGPALRVTVSNIKRPEQFTARVLQAAGTDFQTLKASEVHFAAPAP